METTYGIKDRLLLSKSFDFGTFHIYPNYVIGEINEGVFFELKHAAVVLELIAEVYGDNRKYVYISNRIFSFTVQILDWAEFSKLVNYKNLKAFAVVAKTLSVDKNFEFESKFAKVPYQKFNSLEGAINWAKVTLTDKS